MLSLTALFHVKFIAIYLISALAHELVHAITILYLDCSTSTLKFTALGFSLQAEGLECIPKYKRLLIYISGCLSNIAIIAFYAYRYPTALVINILIIVYNLLPIEGFDGKNILVLLTSNLE